MDGFDSSIYFKEANKQYFGNLVQKKPERKEKTEEDKWVFHENVPVMKRGQHDKTKAKLEKEAIGYFLTSQSFAWNFVGTFLTEVLLAELLPDIVICALAQPSVKTRLKLQKSSTKEQIRQRNSNKTVSGSLMDEMLVEVLRDLSVDVIRSTMKEFVDDHFLKATLYDIIDELVTGVVQTELLSMIEEMKEDSECYSIFENLIHNITDEEVNDAAIYVLNEYEQKIFEVQQSQV
ncbi:hypothetical protein GDO86_012758 [Hymenochirus boettgeri]|uniref:Uncharacterized protein n=1 Tax=Hymenochirus boettgeri TaxID=247094 RepID=A0A8T2ISC1_9PIPI|nr:hypothetical protein GDO86_012758 [Hymenochirus boettgeri]